MNKIVVEKFKSLNKFIKKLDNAYWACYRFVRDYLFQPVWYRIFGHKHHIVKTGLTPSPWYDTDTKMLYAVMSLVEWYVNNDMRIFTKEEFMEEIVRIKNEDPIECQEDDLKAWQGQYKRDQEIIEIANWWKNYHQREKEIEDALNKWHEYVSGFQKNKESFMGFFNTIRDLTEDQKKKEEALFKIHRDLEMGLIEEEQKMLKKAVELRQFMWS